MSDSPLTLAGLFAGVGGIERGFQQAGFAPVIANEIDPYAVQTYKKQNYGHDVIEADIKNFGNKELPKKLSVLTGGFPCQPFSVAGYRKGFDDERGNVFWQIERLYAHSSPEVVFLENVKNLQNHDGGNTYKTIEASLIKHGYNVTSKVLNAKEYGGIPQNRERIYIVGFKDENAFERFNWDAIEKIQAAPLRDFIDFNTEVDRKYYYTEERPFFDKLVEEITSTNTIYQWRRQYVRANKSGDCPTLTANMGMGGHNVPLILAKHGIRKLTPQECFNLMGFENMILPEGMADSRLYKQAGNAVVVPVIKRIADQIKSSIRP